MILTTLNNKQIDMNILFLGGIYPREHKEKIFKNSKRGFQFAAQNLQEAIINGFNENSITPDIVTFPFVSTFPLGYRSPVICYGKVNTHCKCVNFINIPFIKSKFNTCKSDVFDWCKRFEGNDKKHIIVYSLTPNLMKVALEAKKTFKNVDISVIIPDLPQYMGCNRIYKALGLKEKDNLYIMNNIIHFDNFILLTKAMATSLSIVDRNYCVVEGIFNSKPEMSEYEGKDIEQNTKTILYSGALLSKYGINTLLKAFSSLTDSRYRLVICGDGQAKDIVAEAAAKDNRIKFLGKVDYSQVIAMQRKADLLVNPRTPAGEYTKYSFPSKTMEYFASGTPVLMYKLPGILKEYFDFCYTIEDTSAKALAEEIDFILSLPPEQRKDMGEKAAKFITENKNAKIQVGRIIQLISK